MTDIPDRTIGGLNRRPDLSRLQAKNREPVVLRPLDVAAGELTPPPAPEDMPDLVLAAEPRSVPAAPPAAPRKKKVKVGAYLDESLRNQVRAAYAATRGIEGDETFSDFVERAIRTELERREDLHNGGLPYEEETERLPPGRGHLD